MLYFTFGYFVAWRNPAVQAYYGGSDPGTFLLQIGIVLRETPWLPLFQIPRSLVWVGVTLPALLMLRRRIAETAVAVAINFVILTNAAFLYPNPLMPVEVVAAHFAETSTSNFIFGLIVTGVVLWNPGKPEI